MEGEAKREIKVKVKTKMKEGGCAMVCGERGME
jgi:hypothetical protein